MVQTPVPKTGWRASVRVRLLHLPPLEDDLAVARAPFAKRMDPDGLRFDSAGFRASISFLVFARSIAAGPHAPPVTRHQPVKLALQKAIAPAALERAPFRFRAPRRRSPTRTIWFDSRSVHSMDRTPTDGTSLYEGNFSWLRHSGARALSGVSRRAEPTRTWIAHW